MIIKAILIIISIFLLICLIVPDSTIKTDINDPNVNTFNIETFKDSNFKFINHTIEGDYHYYTYNYNNPKSYYSDKMDIIIHNSTELQDFYYQRYKENSFGGYYYIGIGNFVINDKYVHFHVETTDKITMNDMEYYKNCIINDIIKL